MTKLLNNSVLHNLLLTSSIPLTLADRRLYNYLLRKAFPKFKNQIKFQISLAELTGVYGVGIPPLNRLKESLRRLIRTLIEFESKTTWVITNLLEKAELNEQSAMVFYSYPSECKKLFSDPIILEKCLIQAHFTQKYSNLLYEILATAHYSQAASLPIAISDLRDRLFIKENKLINFNDFNRFVLIPAVKEINSCASFAVKYFTQRKGMKVVAVHFEMHAKRDISTIETVIPVKRPRLFIDNPEIERAYAYLLNAETKERLKFFKLANKIALKNNVKIAEEEFDRPDLWFKWIERQLIKKIKDKAE